MHTRETTIAIDSGAPTIDLADDNWEYLHRQLKRNAQRRAELDADEALLLLEAERAQLWRKLGHGSMYDYMERELGYAPRLARERLRVAYALEDLPHTFDALAAGELCFSAVRELTRVATRETEDAWLGATAGTTLREIEEQVAGHRAGDLPDAPVDRSQIRTWVRFEVTPATLAMIRQVRALLTDELGQIGSNRAVERSDSGKRTDPGDVRPEVDDDLLLATLCRRTLEGESAAVDAPNAAVTAEQLPSRPAHQIALTTCRECSRAWQDGAGRVIEVDRAVLERAACDAELLGDAAADPPERVTTTVTARKRRQIFARDHHGRAAAEGSRTVLGRCRFSRGRVDPACRWSSCGYEDAHHPPRGPRIDHRLQPQRNPRHDDHQHRKSGHVAANGLSYYYEIRGRGAPLLLLHGGLGTLDMFGPLLPQLAANHTVIAVDLQGHGRTALGDRDLSLVDMGDDMATVVEQLGYPRVEVMGYSLGAGVAFRMAVQHPTAVTKLVLVSAGFSTDGFYPEMRSMQAQVSAAAAPMMKDTPMYKQYVAVAPHPEEFGKLLDKLGAFMRKTYDWSADVAKVTAPTLLVCGDSDMFRLDHIVEFYHLLGGGQRDAGWQREHISRNRLAILPDRTHYDIFMSPQLGATVIPFLDGTSATATWADQVAQQH